MYFVVRTIARIVVHSFFREITLLNKERIPLYGPVIFVGNHNNQFVDGSMLLAMLPRRVRFLIAEKIIGRLAQAVGSIAVARPQDKIYRGLGIIYWEEGTSTVHGVGSHFLLDVHVGDKIRTMNDQLIVTIKDVVSDTEMVVAEVLPKMVFKQKLEAKPVDEPPKLDKSNSDAQRAPGSLSPGEPTIMFKPPNADTLKQPTVDVSTDNACEPADTGFSFSVIPRVDQSDVYDAVADALIQGDSIGIFPEGGSHDQLHLLPLKPGVAIMALTAAAEGAEDVMIVPVGLTYYQAHKILSRAIMQVGQPLVIPEDLVHLFQKDRRAAASKLLSMIEQGLRSCTVSAPNYKTLKIVRLCVTLYVPENQYLSPDQYHTLYHAFSVLLSKYYEHPRIVSFMQDAQEYATLLKGYGIADHEVRQLRQSAERAILAMVELFLFFLLAAAIGLVPAILWGPVRAMSSYLAEQHRKMALAESKVKVAGRDVVARLNAWRENEKEIITRRMQMQLAVRQLVKDMAEETGEPPMYEIERCVPEVVCMTDSKRIARRLETGDFIPIAIRRTLECREEIL